MARTTDTGGRAFAALLGLAALAAASILPTPLAAQDAACVREQKPMVQTELIFGRNIGGRLGVTEARWARFLAHEITPRFPGGLTVIDGQGQWRDTVRGALVRERSKIVLVIAPDDDVGRDHISAIVAAYKRRFRQQSVAVLTRRVCASF
jgi:hypothetical protein